VLGAVKAASLRSAGAFRAASGLDRACAQRTERALADGRRLSKLPECAPAGSPIDILRVMRLFLTTSIIVGLCVVAASCGRSADGPNSVDGATAVVAGHLPSGWTVATREDGQLPQGHYWGDWGRDYAGPRGRHLVVVGRQPVAMSWRANDGSSHKDAIAKESLDIWIMPGNYREGFWSRINPHAPAHPSTVFSGQNVKVFAMPSHKLIDENRFKEIGANASVTEWPDSPWNTGKLSWTDWRTALADALVKGS